MANDRITIEVEPVLNKSINSKFRRDKSGVLIPLIDSVAVYKKKRRCQEYKICWQKR